MTQDTVRKIEQTIANARKHVDLGLALDRLEQNTDFKKLILDGYLNAEAVRLVHLKSDPHMQTADRQASVVKEIDAIGGLISYFRVIDMNASRALQDIEQGEAEREEILAEELA